MQGLLFSYSKWDLNPHAHHWARDFKSLVSTDSTIRARNSPAKVVQAERINKFIWVFLRRRLTKSPKEGLKVVQTERKCNFLIFPSVSILD